VLMLALPAGLEPAYIAFDGARGRKPLHYPLC